MNEIELNVINYDTFEVMDIDGNLITGLVDVNFTKDLYNPSGTEVSGSIPVTVVELGGGNYKQYFTPNAEGNWLSITYHATYFPNGKRASYTCLTRTADIDAMPYTIWDEVLIGATHNVTSSAGKRLRELSEAVITTGVAVSATVNTIVLNGDASSTDGAYDPAAISIIGGTGLGQTRLIYEYIGLSKTAILDRDWKTTPDVTSEYIISAHPGREHVNEGLLQSATNNTAKLNILASGTNDVYNGQFIFIRSGTGQDQVKMIISYDGTNKIVTNESDWAVNPSSDSAYVIIPNNLHPDIIARSVWDTDLNGHISAESTGFALALTSYDGEVYIDIANGESGTIFPIGTPHNPVDNLADALTISNTYFIDHFNITGALVISLGEDISGYTFGSDRSLGNSVTVTNAITNGTYFNDLTVSGTMNGPVRYTYCVLGDIINFDGGAKNSLLTGDITITGTGANYFTDTDTYVTGPGYQSIDAGNKSVNIIRARGSYEIINFTGTILAMDFAAGNVKIASSCTAGMITVAGLVRLIDESGAGCIVIDGTLSETGTADAVWDEYASGHTTAGTYGQDIFTSISTSESNIRGGSDTLGSLSDQIDLQATEVNLNTQAGNIITNTNNKHITTDAKIDLNNSEIKQAITDSEGYIRGASGKTLTDISDEIAALDAGTLGDIDVAMQKVMGLAQHNIVIDNITRNTDLQIIEAHMTLYTDNTLVTPLTSYTATYTFVDALMTLNQVVED